MDPIYDARTYEPRKAIGYLVNRVRAELLAALDQELSADPALAALEVSAAQYVILSSLADRATDSAASLCKHMSYDPGAMTRMIDRLESKGLLHRKRCEDDRRLVNVELTDEGRAAVPRMRACSVAVLNRLLAGFSKAEVRQFEQFLGRMVENL